MDQGVWGVMYAMGLLLTGTGYVLYYIMRIAYREMNEETDSVNSIVDTSTSS